MTLLNHARKKAEAGKRKEYEAYMAAAYEKFQPLLNADNLDPWALFCVARWAAIDNRYDECRYWLEKFQERDNYLPRATTGKLCQTAPSSLFRRDISFFSSLPFPWHLFMLGMLGLMKFMRSC